MSKDHLHEETYEHANGKKYNVRWYCDYDTGSPIDQYGDCHGVVYHLDWNPTNEEQLEQHIADNEPELEEETGLRMMRQVNPPERGWGKGLYYDVMASLEKARTEWGITDPVAAMAAVEKDFAYIKGWYDDDWHWVTIGVAPVTTDDDGDEIDEDHREFCGGYESTILDNDEENTTWRDEVITEQIAAVEWTLRKELHKNQLELDL